MGQETATTSKKTLMIDEIIFNQIKSRYHIQGRSFTNINNYIMDGNLPIMVLRQMNRKYRGTYSPIIRTYKNHYSIGELSARILKTKQLPIEALVKAMDMSMTDVRKMLAAIKREKYTLTIMGMGGSMSNFIYWTAKLAEYTGISEIFSYVSIYEEEHYDISNVLRIPFIPQYKDADIYTNERHNPKKPHMVPQWIYTRIANEVNTVNAYLNTSEILGYNTVLIGAPNLETREKLYNEGTQWFGLLHQDDRFKIVNTPRVDRELLIENYGKIKLDTFFLNQFVMTVQFLKILANGTKKELGINRFSRLAKNNEIQEIEVRRNTTVVEGRWDGFMKGSYPKYGKGVHTFVANINLLPDQEEEIEYEGAKNA